jgi:hypothetical protein
MNTPRVTFGATPLERGAIPEAWQSQFLAMNNTPRAAFGVTPLEGGRCQRPGKAGSSASLDISH